MNRQWLLHERPVGMIGPEHFKYVETDIPEPGEGEVLIRNLMFSFDPTQRGWT
ncbi:MAG: NADP-dependent oxidoreductase, partial [Luminiphilus sp.]